jgi:hypothetical protein
MQPSDAPLSNYRTHGWMLGKRPRAAPGVV